MAWELKKKKNTHTKGHTQDVPQDTDLGNIPNFAQFSRSMTFAKVGCNNELPLLKK